jgi:hypothetical protein
VTREQTGGTAFPCPSEHGMSLRDYFAARAPAAIPKWFVHRKPPRDFPELPRWFEFFDGEADRKSARLWLDGGDFDLAEQVTDPDRGRAFAGQVVASREGYAAWKAADVAERYFQWRWHYAAAMLRTREGGAA